MRILALMKRISIQMIRDKRTLALMMVAPLLILTLFHFLFNSDPVYPRLGVTNGNNTLIKQLQDQDIIVKHYEQVDQIKQTMIDDDLDGFLQIEAAKIKITLENSDPTISRQLQIKIQQSFAAQAAKQQAEQMKKLQQYLRQSSATQEPKESIPPIEKNKPPIIETNYLYGDKDTTFFEVISPIFIGFFVFFFVFLISGIALLRERTTGTLDKLLATPIRRGEIVSGYVLGYGFFAIIQTVIVVLYAIKGLDMMLVGSLWLVILTNLLLALVALSLGTLLSAFANSEFQMMQFIPIAIIPQVFFSGIFPVEGMANWLQVIAKFMPLYYGAHALQSVMIKGLGFSDIQNDLLILLAFAVVFLSLNVLALRKYRKI